MSDRGHWAFNDHMNGHVLRWYEWDHEDGKASASCLYAAPKDTPYRVIEHPYARIPYDQRIRFAGIDCLFCHRKYWGWYVLDPYPVDAEGNPDIGEDDEESGRYRLFGTSYYHAFNDEPCDEDLALVRDVPMDVLVDALDLYHGALRVIREMSSTK